MINKDKIKGYIRPAAVYTGKILYKAIIFAIVFTIIL